MASKKSFVRKLIFAYLFLCATGILVFIGFELYKRFGPSTIKLESVPFGLSVGSELLVGDSPEFQKTLEE